MADGRFRPLAKTRFGPGTPETGPNRVFALKTPPSYEKRVAWVHPAWPARRSFWVSVYKWTDHFGPLGPEKRPKRPVSGHQREKPNQRLRRHRNFGRFTRWNISDQFINGPVTEFLPVASGHFQPLAKTRFGPGTPETGPNRVFALKTPPSYGKRVAWVHPAWPSHRSFWVSVYK